MAKSYEEILKELQEQTKSMSYIPVEVRNVHNSSNSTLSNDLKYNKARNKTQKADEDLRNTIKTLTPLNNIHNPFRSHEELITDRENAYKNKEKIDEVMTHNTAQEIGMKLMSSPRESLSLKENFAKEYQNSYDFKKSINEESEKKFKEQAENLINTGIEESWAKYAKELEVAQNKTYNLWDKTGGRFLDGMLKTANLKQGPQVKDEHGNWYNLPTTQDITNDAIRKQTDNDLLRFTGDVLYNTGRIATSAILNKVIPGAGSTAYFSTMYMDNYNNARQNGYDDEKAGIYSTISTATELLTEKLLGGTTKLLTGGKASILNQGIANGLSKIMNNNNLINVLSHAGAEATEEFLQEYIDNITKNIVLGEDNDILGSEVLGDALYSAAVGGVTGVFGSVGDNSLEINTKKDLQQNNAILPNLNALNSLQNEKNSVTVNSINSLQNQKPILPSINNIQPQENNLFSKQVDDVINGKFNKDNHMTVLEHTPKILQNLGVNDYPITLTTNKLDRIMNESGKQNGEYHGLGANIVKKIPQALQNPLDIVKSYNNSYVLTTDLSDNQNRQIIASIKIDGKGYINNIEIDTNVMTSAYGRNNYDNWMNKNKDNIVYDIDRGYISEKKLDTIPGLQLPNNSNKLSNDNLTQYNENVKLPSTKYSMHESKNNVWQEHLVKNYKLNNKGDTLEELKLPKPINKNSSEQDIKLFIANSENNKSKTKEIKNNTLDPIEISNLTKKEANATSMLPKNPTKESSYDNVVKKTRKLVQEELQKEMKITAEDLQVGHDINSIDMQRTDPIRLNEKIFGAKIGKKINDATINKTKHNEAERTRYLNKEREDIKALGIKARSKESAAVQKYAEKQFASDNGVPITYGDKDLAIEFPDVNTQNKIKNAAKVLRNKYDTYIEQINDVITELGYDAIPKRNDYMRHFQEIDSKLAEWGIPLTNLKDNEIPTDINGLTDQFRPGKNWFASAMERKGKKTTYDAITGIDGYLEGASNLIFHTEDIQRYRALSKLIRDNYGQTHGFDGIENLTEEDAQQKINDIYDNKLSKYVAWLDEQANSLAGKKGAIDRGAERILGRKIYGVLEAAKKQVGSNMTGFNIRSALTNFASSVQGASKANKIAFVKGTISTIKNIIHNDGMIEKSDFLTSRFGSNQLSSKMWQKISNAGQILMSGSDYFTSNQIWRSKYFENLQNGMNEQQAIKNADDFSSRIMGDRSKGATAEIFNSKTLGLLTQFQLEVNNQWSSIIHDNKMDIQNGNKSGATVLFQLGQLAAFSYLFNNLMKSLTGSDVMIDPIDMLMKMIGKDDDDDEDEEKTLEERSYEVLGDLINDMPFASILTGGRIPISEAFSGPATLFKKTTNQTDSYGNKIKWDDVSKDMISSGFYWLLPTGFGQIKKTYNGSKMYDSKLPLAGSYTDSGNLRFNADKSISGKIKAVLFGQYSNEEAQKYIDSGYKTISKNNIQEMKDLGMTSSEYRDYRQGLTAAGTKNEDKINYINNLDNISVNKKNIMASNVLKKDFDIQKYNKYSSYEEYDFAEKNPKKYLAIKQISTYDNYTKYKKEIDSMREKSKNKKTDTISYINSLKMNIAQKAMFIKMYYSSFDEYNDQIIEYINSRKVSKSEKETILLQLGFTIKDGKVFH